MSDDKVKKKLTKETRCDERRNNERCTLTFSIDHLHEIHLLPHLDLGCHLHGNLVINHVLFPGVDHHWHIATIITATWHVVLEAPPKLVLLGAEVAFGALVPNPEETRVGGVIQVHLAHGVLQLLLRLFRRSDFLYVGLEKRGRTLGAPALVPLPLGLLAALGSVPVVLDGVFGPSRHSPCNLCPFVPQFLVGFNQDFVLLFAP